MSVRIRNDNPDEDGNWPEQMRREAALSLAVDFCKGRPQYDVLSTMRVAQRFLGWLNGESLDARR